MRHVRISTHRVALKHAKLLDSMFETVDALKKPGERKVKHPDFCLQLGTLKPWNGGDGWQGVLRRIRSNGMDPATDTETGLSRPLDHKKSEGQGAGAAFIFDRPRRVLVFFHGIPHATVATLVNYLLTRTGSSVEGDILKGIPKQGALENFAKAKNIRYINVPLDGNATHALASIAKGSVWSAIKDVSSDAVSAQVSIKLDIRSDANAKDAVEEALIANTGGLDFTVSYTDSQGRSHKNVDLGSELFVEKLIPRVDDQYALDNDLMKYVHANYELMLGENPVLCMVPKD